MKTLAAADTLAAGASVAAQLTSTVFGMEYSVALGEVYKVLDQRQLAATPATIYTAPALTTAFVRTITVVNNDTVVRTAQFFRGGTAAANAITQPVSIPGGGMAVYEDGDGWTVYDSASNMQTGYTPPTGLLRGIINVKDYGATGDGATNDAVAIQAAINAAGAAGVSGRGVDLWFPPGVYAIGTTLACAFNNVMFRGGGWQSTVLYATFTTGDILQFGAGVAKSGCGLMNMSVWCSAARTTGASININAMSDCVIQNFVINNCFQGIYVQGTALKVWIDQGEINNINTTASAAGIKVVNGLGGDTYVSNIVISNNPASKGTAGIHITQTGHTSLFRCNITSCVKGLLVDPAAAATDVNYLFIDHCLFDSCGSHAAHFTATVNAGARIRSIIAVNSWFSGTLAAGSGIEFTASTGIIDGVSFIGCRVLNNYNHGITINAAATNISFTNCTIAGNGAQTINTYDGITIAANVNNVSIVNCGISQQGTAGNQQRYAVAIAAGTSAGIQIVNNQLSPNGTVGTGSYMNLGALTGANNNISGNSPQAIGGSARTMPAQVATSGAGETLIFAAKIDANSVKIGDTFRISTHGISSSTGTLIFRVKVGANGTTGDTEAWIALTSAAQVANQRGGFDALLTVRSLTTIECEGLGYAQAALLPTVIAAVATKTITSTAAWYIDITCTCSVGTWTAQQAAVVPL